MANTKPPNPPAPPPLNVDYPRKSDDILRSLQKAYERINSLQHSLSTLPPTLTTSDVQALVGPAAHEALTIGGSNPIFITQVTGGTQLTQLFTGTHSQRLTAYASPTVLGPALFYETDRTVYYQVINSTWVYTTGIMRAALASLPTGLTASDAGFLFFATDYLHTYIWSGSVWSYAPGDEGSGRIVYFSVAPRGGLWQKLDGSTGVTESLANATTALVAFSGLAAGTVPNLTGTPSYLRSAATCTGVVNAATAPAFTGTPAPLVTADFTLIGSPALITLDGSATSYTPAGTISASGQPRNMDAIPYYRL